MEYNRGNSRRIWIVNGMRRIKQRRPGNWGNSSVQLSPYPVDLPDSAELADKAYSDYMQLFVGPGTLRAPPWSFTHLKPNRLMFQEVASLVRSFHKTFGLELKKKNGEPDDHISIELEFLGHLAECGEGAAFNDFVKIYMLPWIPKWNNDVQIHAHTDYFKGLAKMASGGINRSISQ